MPSSRHSAAVVRFLKTYLRPLKLVVVYGRHVAARRTMPGQIMDMYRCIGTGYHPFNYYYWRLYEPGRAATIRAWVTQREAHAFSKTVLAAVGPDVVSDLDDKSRFDTYCARAGLPTIKVLARVLPDTAYSEFKDVYSSLCRNLLAKPIGARQGIGAVRYDWDGTGHVDQDGCRYDSYHLFEHLKELIADHGPYLVQPLVVNHESIERICGAALACVRVLSYLDEETPRIAVATCAMSAGDSFIANFTHGALAASVNRTTGVLGKAKVKVKPTGPPLGAHPGTGAEIVGFQLPCWDDVVELVLRAHLAYDKIPVIGWDIAITPEGPVIIEGNADPGVESLQFVHDTPLTDFFDFRELATRFRGGVESAK